MKVITIRQPFAAAILAGLKRYEIRSWQTRHRGPLLIHAAGSYDFDAIADVLGSPKQARLLGLGDARSVELGAARLPMSAIVGLVELQAIRPTDDVPTRGRGWGDFPPGYFAWKLGDPCRLPPVPMAGRLGIWDLELSPTLAAALKKSPGPALTPKGRA